MKEAITIEQLFTEELRAITEMLDALVDIRDNECDPLDPDYYEIQNTIVRYEQTALYLQDRLNDRVPPKQLRLN